MGQDEEEKGTEETGMAIWMQTRNSPKQFQTAVWLMAVIRNGCASLKKHRGGGWRVD